MSWSVRKGHCRQTCLSGFDISGDIDSFGSYLQTEDSCVLENESGGSENGVPDGDDVNITSKQN